MSVSVLMCCWCQYLCFVCVQYWFSVDVLVYVSIIVLSVSVVVFCLYQCWYFVCFGTEALSLSLLLFCQCQYKLFACVSVDILSVSILIFWLCQYIYFVCVMSVWAHVLSVSMFCPHQCWCLIHVSIYVLFRSIPACCLSVHTFCLCLCFACVSFYV